MCPLWPRPSSVFTNLSESNVGSEFALFHFACFCTACRRVFSHFAASSQAPEWFRAAISNMTNELPATRQAAHSALEVSSTAQRELSALKHRAPSSPSNPAPKFRSTGLEKQHEVNSSVLETIDAALETLPPEASEAKAFIEAGKSIVETRQKHIRIANAHGLEVVRQYEAGSLGDSAEDDRRIASAAVSAHRQQPFSDGGRRRGYFAFNDYRRQGPRPAGTTPQLGVWQPKRWDNPQWNFPTRQFPSDIRYFVCGQSGHVARNCYSHRRHIPAVARTPLIPSLPSYSSAATVGASPTLPQ